MSPAPEDTAKSREPELTDLNEDRTSVEVTEVEDTVTEGAENVDGTNSENNATPNSPLLNPTSTAPPLPDEAPPLPEEEPPAPVPADDGWAPVWEETAQAFYFYNRFTGATQWTNPRVPDATTASIIPTAPGVDPPLPESESAPEPVRPAGGYDPAIHGDYDPEAWYAQESNSVPDPSTSSYALNPATGAPYTDEEAAALDPTAQYAATGAFNRFTGRWQAADVGPETHNDENKSRRQMNAFFDVDAAANSHDGRSLKAERSGKKLSRTEVKQFKEKRKAKKEEKRRAWLRD